MLEIWKDIPNFEGYYQASNLGKIKSLNHIRLTGTGSYVQKGRILKYHTNPYGYYQVRLSKNGIAKTYKVHKLIAITFIENIDDKPTVNHKNGNKLDNNIVNLEWATRSEQTRHMHEVLGYPYRKGIDLAHDRWKNHVKNNKEKTI